MSDNVQPSLRLIKTPRFPNGLAVGDLPREPLPVQKETMATWFLSHYVPATGTYFGFSGPEQSSAVLNTSAPNSFTLNQTKIGGFNQGAWFTGGRAPELLRNVFDVGLGPLPIDEVALMFDGLWEAIPAEPATTLITVSDITTALTIALNSFEARFRSLVPEHGGVGHNQPPEDEPVTPDEKDTVLRAVAEMKLAISSGSDLSVLDKIWSGIMSIVSKIAIWSQKHINIFVENFVAAAGKSVGAKVGLLLVALYVRRESDTITELVKLILQFK